MKNKKKNGYNPREYWKDKVGFNSNEEFLIYQYLCGNIKGKKVKKINEKKKFQKYKTWREYIEKFLKSCDNDTLSEFYHFIKLEARYCDIDMGMYTQFAIPLSVAMVAGTIIPWLLNSNLFKGIETQQSGPLGLISLFITCLVMVYGTAAIIIFFLLSLFSNYVRSKNEVVFWKDYLEIVEMEMKVRKVKE